MEKAKGYYESRLAAVLIYFIEAFLEEHDLGIVVGPDGASRLLPGLVRIPDVSFVSWDRLPDRQTPRGPLPDLVPDLAVEVISKSNALREMERKLRDYFQAGVHLVWYADPPTQSVRVYTTPEECTVVADDGAVLPGFTLAVREWFARADRTQGND